MNPTQTEFNQKNFYIAHLNTEQLSQNSYYLQSNQEAAIIDPLRDIQYYINLSRQRESDIRYIFLTHIPSDYISGHLDLAAEVGATIVIGPGGVFKFKVHLSKDDQEFKIGNIVIQTVSTPGHTAESACFALNDGKRTAALFTGNTILLGDVGRPDTTQIPQIKNVDAEDLAGWLYDSIRGQILLTFQDDVIIFPGHSKGCFYGTKITVGTHDLLGNQQKSNTYLQKMLRNDFSNMIISDMIKLPEVYNLIASINREGPMRYNDLFGMSNTPIKIEDAISLVKNPDVLVLDSRNYTIFAQDFIPGSINIDLTCQFSFFACDVLNPNKDILVVAEEGEQRITIAQLLRVGYQRIKGFLKGGFNTWRDMDLPTDSYEILPPIKFQEIQLKEEVTVIDIRSMQEVQLNGCLKDSINIDYRFFFNFIKENPTILPKGNDIFLHCFVGKKAAIIISMLQQMGKNNVFNIGGGFQGIQKDIPELVVTSL